MPHSLHTTLCALMLALPAVALAQEEAPAEEVVVEEMPAQDVPVDESATPAEEAAVPAEPTEEAAAPTEEAAPPAEEAAADASATGEPIAEEGAATAAALRSRIDGYSLVKSDLKIGPGSDDGDGYGVRALLVAGEHSVATAEYQTASFSKSGLDIDQLRVGMGVTRANSATGLYVEFDQIDLEDETADGPGVHGRYVVAFGPVEVHGSLGHLWLRDSNEQIWGPEISAGAAFAFGSFGVFADYRMSKLEAQDSGVDVELTDIRAGVRFYF
ncbi:MAG TPA: hypothetical protein VM240_03085 [Verrucomicrobiae bacterium]|nr:hypothetical protein [Verrucomicrobiae bacterium]